MIYARPGIAEALIGLQERAGHNVNLILFGLWLGLCEALRLDATALARANAAIEPIERDVVAPLRQLRRAIKDRPDADMRDLRRRVLALELTAERRAQARLTASIASRRKRAGDRHAIAEANLRLILGGDFASAETALVLRSVAG